MQKRHRKSSFTIPPPFSYIKEGSVPCYDVYQRQEEDTYSEVFEDELEKHAKPHKRSWKEDERRYNLYMKGKLGNKPLSWFSSDRVRKWHNDITKTPKQRGGEIVAINDRGRKSKKVVNVTGSTANRALALLSTIFDQMRPTSVNPCKEVKKFQKLAGADFCNQRS